MRAAKLLVPNQCAVSYPATDRYTLFVSGVLGNPSLLDRVDFEINAAEAGLEIESCEAEILLGSRLSYDMTPPIDSENFEISFLRDNGQHFALWTLGYTNWFRCSLRAAAGVVPRASDISVEVKRAWDPRGRISPDRVTAVHELRMSREPRYELLINAIPPTQFPGPFLIGVDHGRVGGWIKECQIRSGPNWSGWLAPFRIGNDQLLLSASASQNVSEDEVGLVRCEYVPSTGGDTRRYGV